MISSHFPSTYGHKWNWLVLVLISLLSVAVRHYYNVRKQGTNLIWVLPLSFAGYAVLMWMTAPEPQNRQASAATNQLTTADILPVIQARCSSCHAKSPSQQGFAAPPAGLALETERQITENAGRIYQASVVTKTMPLANLTGITDAERQQLDTWFRSLNAQGVNKGE